MYNTFNDCRVDTDLLDAIPYNASDVGDALSYLSAVVDTLDAAPWMFDSYDDLHDSSSIGGRKLLLFGKPSSFFKSLSKDVMLKVAVGLGALAGVASSAAGTATTTGAWPQ